MKTYTVVLDGKLQVTTRLLAQIADTGVIVADGAIRYIKALHVTPELWVGDFDSTKPDLNKKYAELERRTFPVAKDKTDGELAVDFALERGARRVILCGALGGKRSDHAFFHLTYALALKERGIDVFLTSGHEEAYVILPGNYSFNFSKGTTFSVIGLTDLGGLSLEGAKWPLGNRDVSFGSSLTLSNVVTDELHLSLDHGKAILFANVPCK